MKLNLPFRNRDIGKQGISYLGPKIWNNLGSNIKSCDNINTFKHRIKEKYFIDIRNKERDLFLHY